MATPADKASIVVCVECWTVVIRNNALIKGGWGSLRMRTNYFAEKVGEAVQEEHNLKRKRRTTRNG